MVFDCIPFFNELDILEVRLNELAGVVDQFIILEAGETYGGTKKPYNLIRNWERFSAFHNQMTLICVPHLYPDCTNRVTGRMREANQRNAMMTALEPGARADDIIMLSDCDEIPSEEAVFRGIDMVRRYGIHRFKQHSYYYNVQTRVDYGHDFASRARIGTFAQVMECGSLYDFRMHQKGTCPGIENGGWHFSYFGGPAKIKDKVSALSPFLSEYKLFGDAQLEQDIRDRRDLHHRRCEMPEVFEDVSEPVLPAYLSTYRSKFPHFFRKAASV